MNPIRCQSILIKFKQGSGQNTLELKTSDVGSTSYLLVTKSDNVLLVEYARQSVAGVVALEAQAFNFDLVFSFSCEGIPLSSL